MKEQQKTTKQRFESYCIGDQETTGNTTGEADQNAQIRAKSNGAFDWYLQNVPIEEATTATEVLPPPPQRPVGTSSQQPLTALLGRIGPVGATPTLAPMPAGSSAGFPGLTPSAGDQWGGCSPGQSLGQQGRVTYQSGTHSGDDAPPRFGLMGLTTPGAPVNVEKTNWKQLTELPKLLIPHGEAWERTMIMATWIKEIVLAAVSQVFSNLYEVLLRQHD